MSSINRPQEILKLWPKILPDKKLALQQAFVTVDSHGDGYITLEDFIKAFKMINADVSPQTLKYIFDCLCEKFVTNSKQSDDSSNNEQKVISISYF